MSELRRFWRNREGLAAIEFALIAPLMILIYFIMVEFCQGYMANRRASHTASILADLVAQSDSTSRADLAAVFEIGTVIMRPFSADSLSIRITSVIKNKDGKTVVEWSKDNQNALTAHAKDAVLQDVPGGLIDEDETLILGETAFEYALPMGHVIKQPIIFRRSYYLRPRSVDRVICSDC